MEIEGKVAFVSGANRGIGKAITEELLANGAKKVYAGARKVDSLNELKEKYGDKLVPVELEFLKDDTIEKAASIATDVEILINNAGILVPGGFTQGDLFGSLKSNLDVNLLGAMKLTKALLDTIKKQESGAIATISSVAGLANMPVILTYCISKAALHSFIQGLRAELKKSNILVSGIYPGPIDTDMTKGIDMEKASPETVAKNVVQGLKDGVEDIFPDPFSKQIGEAYLSSPKGVEKQFADFDSL